MKVRHDRVWEDRIVSLMIACFLVLNQIALVNQCRNKDFVPNLKQLPPTSSSSSSSSHHRSAQITIEFPDISFQFLHHLNFIKPASSTRSYSQRSPPASVILPYPTSHLLFPPFLPLAGFVL